MVAPNHIRLVSVSGGKDSTATLLLALETNWQGDVRAVFADTGNEHETTLEYVEILSEYLHAKAGRRVETVRADFTKGMAAKRAKLLAIASGVPESEIYGKRVFSEAWTPERATRAAVLMHPTGNAFLDLCLLKGGFPSRKRQFCTEHLKRDPLDLRMMAFVSAGHAVEQWHGIRGEESPHRAAQPDYEWGPILSVRRPILRWGVDRVFEQHRRHGISPNPLYSQGMGRVGCMPCINSGKKDINEIAKRFPEHIDKVFEYESLVSQASRNPRAATFFHQRTSGGRGIEHAVQWSTTSRGGRQQDFILGAAPEVCSSMYGLCE
jgi:3'-phosphoadenosine 5'-phosphosulfate sulfotransferase (PAPS reductase)/FAD synthetase